MLTRLFGSLGAALVTLFPVVTLAQGMMGNQNNTSFQNGMTGMMGGGMIQMMGNGGFGWGVMGLFGWVWLILITVILALLTWLLWILIQRFKK